MAALKFIVKFFPEITIKSKPVRRQFVKQLSNNLRRVLSEIDPGIKLQQDWDKLVVASSANDPAVGARLVEALGRVAGIAYFSEVLEFPLGDFDDILARTREVYEPLLPGRNT